MRKLNEILNDMKQHIIKFEKVTANEPAEDLPCFIYLDKFIFGFIIGHRANGKFYDRYANEIKDYAVIGYCYYIADDRKMFV